MEALVASCMSRLEVSAPLGDSGGGGGCVGTHNGTFHCDEALAVGLLQLTAAHKAKKVLRTRDASVLHQCEIVVDVGGEFDPERLRFDHHQRGFEETFSETKDTKLSSAGLVYKYFGLEILQGIAGAVLGARVKDEKLLHVIYERVYEGFVEHIDGIDNGIDPFTGEKRYSISTHLSARVGDLNLPWNAPEAKCSTNHEMEQFKKACTLTLTEFVLHVEKLFTVWLPARDIVARAVQQRKSVHDSGAIVKIDRPCPWKSHVFNLEAEGVDGLNHGDLKYILYPDSNGAWRVQCVPLEECSFTNRLSLPEQYRGLRDEELSKAWGIPGCIFIHASGFIGANKSFDGALKMAKESLLLNDGS